MMSVNEIGSKAFTLKSMQTKGIPIPKSYYLSCSECNRFIDVYKQAKTFSIVDIVHYFDKKGFFVLRNL